MTKLRLDDRNEEWQEWVRYGPSPQIGADVQVIELADVNNLRNTGHSFEPPEKAAMAEQEMAIPLSQNIRYWRTAAQPTAPINPERPHANAVRASTPIER